MNIKGKKVTLRAIEKEDLELMREMLNDPEIENLVVGWAFPISKYQQEKWYENNINNNNNLRFIIETQDKEKVGMISLINLDWKNRKANYGIKLKNLKNRNQGIGTDSLLTLMKYSFEELNLNKIETTILETNSISRNFHLKNGWQEEGLLREIVFKNGKYINGYAMGILKRDYEDLMKKNNYWNE